MDDHRIYYHHRFNVSLRLSRVSDFFLYRESRNRSKSWRVFINKQLRCQRRIKINRVLLSSSGFLHVYLVNWKFLAACTLNVNPTGKCVPSNYWATGKENGLLIRRFPFQFNRDFDELTTLDPAMYRSHWFRHQDTKSEKKSSKRDILDIRKCYIDEINPL
ncbi:uncharacterized protein LOC143147414 [Ptiloglossa arizonensis]|uniref:uncharacterized protein LOC143147414 n=1 Tax=Ptiloglossa arizonensis TaxID=3350558 RepID=UPI003FA12A5A